MAADRRYRTPDDLARVLRALAREFATDTIYIIGSQAILMAWPDAPPDIRGTPEIDAYPGNAEQWEALQAADGGDPIAASEHINGLFGELSSFHEAHGFYIDGVDSSTASLPQGWRSRAIQQDFDVDGRTVTAIAPSPHDLIISKLARLDEKDKAFITTYHQFRFLQLDLLRQRLAATELAPEIADRALAFLRTLG